MTLISHIVYSRLFILFFLFLPISLSAQQHSDATFKIITSLSELTDGEYLIVSPPSDGVVAALNNLFDKGVCKGTPLTIDQGKVVRPPLETVWKFQKTPKGGWSIKNSVTNTYLTQKHTQNSKSLELSTKMANFRCNSIESDGVELFTQQKMSNSFCWEEDRRFFSNYSSFGAFYKKVYLLKRSEDSPKIDAVSMRITNALYATFYNDNAFELPEGLTAYVGRVTSNDTFLLKAIGKKIPAKTAVVIRAQHPGEYSLIPYFGSVLPIPTELNELKGTGEELSLATMQASPNHTYMVLSHQNGETGFYRTGVSIPAGKAYLLFTEHKAQSFTFDFEDSITRLHIPQMNTASILYDLNGNRVERPRNGEIYVRNGKCMIHIGD